MRCPFCHNDDTRVVDSRLGKDGDAIRRRRMCERCERRFTTYEHVELTLPVVVKKDGRRETFDRGKDLAGLRRACEKRPVSVDAIDGLADTIERQMQERGDPEVKSVDIGEVVMRGLQALDEVAYVRFASVYRSFRDVHEFMHELEELIAERQRATEGPGRKPRAGTSRRVRG